VTEPIYNTSHSIGTLHESTLHADLKSWYKELDDQLEVPVGNYIIDIVRDNLLIEIQTKNFSAIKKKLQELVQQHNFLLVHPIVKDKWIIKINHYSNNIISDRLSPIHKSYVDIFEELVSIPELVSNPNLAIEVPLVQIEEYRKNIGTGNWRTKGWKIYDRKLVRVVEKKVFYTPLDFLMLKPANLKTPFTNFDLAFSLNKSIHLARRMTYCLRKMGMIKIAGKEGRAYLFDYE
jgi:hypothetical protein